MAKKPTNTKHIKKIRTYGNAKYFFSEIFFETGRLLNERKKFNIAYILTAVVLFLSCIFTTFMLSVKFNDKEAKLDALQNETTKIEGDITDENYSYLNDMLDNNVLYELFDEKIEKDLCDYRLEVTNIFGVYTQVNIDDMKEENGTQIQFPAFNFSSVTYPTIRIRLTEVYKKDATKAIPLEVLQRYSAFISPVKINNQLVSKDYNTFLKVTKTNVPVEDDQMTVSTSITSSANMYEFTFKNLKPRDDSASYSYILEFDKESLQSDNRELTTIDSEKSTSQLTSLKQELSLTDTFAVKYFTSDKVTNTSVLRTTSFLKNQRVLASEEETKLINLIENHFETNNTSFTLTDEQKTKLLYLINKNSVSLSETESSTLLDALTKIYKSQKSSVISMTTLSDTEKGIFEKVKPYLTLNSKQEELYLSLLSGTAYVLPTETQEKSETLSAFNNLIYLFYDNGVSINQSCKILSSKFNLARENVLLTSDEKTALSSLKTDVINGSVNYSTHKNILDRLVLSFDENKKEMEDCYFTSYKLVKSIQMDKKILRIIQLYDTVG